MDEGQCAVFNTVLSIEKPKSGTIAVKVIDPYGDGVLKVYEVK